MSLLCWCTDAAASAHHESCQVSSLETLHVFPSRGGAEPNDTTSTASKKWSSFFAVDPSKILNVLVNRGGLILPKSVEKELLALKNVLHVDKASLNLVERQLIVSNFTVSVKGSDTVALRVGRVHVTWDSYTKPCVDVQVENVDVLVEFTNLMLSRTNWNELEEAGFPPRMEDYYSDYDASAPSSTFVRIGSIQLSGNITSEIKSRPLDRTIANMTFGLHAFDNLSKEILQVSEANLAATGRRGCTTDQVYDILRAYFMKKLRKFLKYTAYDVSAGSLREEGSTTVREAKRLFASASNVIKSYADDASKKTGDDIQESLAGRLEKLGVPSSREKLDALRELSAKAAENIDARSLAGSSLTRLRQAYQNRVTTGNVIGHEALTYTTGSNDVDNACEEANDSSSEVGSNQAASDCKDTKETIFIFPDW